MAGDRGSRLDPWRGEPAGLIQRWILAAAGLLRPLHALLGVDHDRFLELLRVRLTLALRRSNGTSAAAAVGVTLAILLFAFLGLMTGMLSRLDPMGWVPISTTAMMLLLGLLLLQDLGSILVDPRDPGVVAPHPVSDRTVLAVRLAEVSAHVLVMVVAYTSGAVLIPVVFLPPVAVMLLYPVLALCAGAVVTGLLTLLFATSLRLLGPARFQRATLWVQISSVCLVTATINLPGARAWRESWRWLQEQGEIHPWISALLPPVQYARVFAFATGGRPDFPALELVLALLTPLLALALTFWLASRFFVAGLQGALSVSAQGGRWSVGPGRRIGALLARADERAGFDFSHSLSLREPHFLRFALPQTALLLILFTGMALRADLPALAPALPVMIFVVLLPMVLTHGQGTPTPEAAKVFLHAPIADEAPLLRGGIKALIVQWIGVPAGLLLALQLWLEDLGTWPRIVLAFELAMAASLALSRSLESAVPFTQRIRALEASAENFSVMFLSTFLIAALLGIHFLLTWHAAAMWSAIALLGWACWAQWRALGTLRPARSLRLLPLAPPIPRRSADASAGTP